MLRAVRRRVAVYRVCRQTKGLWDAFINSQTAASQSASDETVVALTEFLCEFLASYERLSKPRMLHRIFGDSFLPVVLDTLVTFIVDNGSLMIKSPEGTRRGRDIIEKALSVCSIILQDPVHSSQVAFNAPLASHILSLLESIDDKDLKSMVLQLITGLCSNHESRLEIARLDGFRKILSLLDHGDDSLSHQILRTLRVFLDAESNNQNIYENRDMSPSRTFGSEDMEADPKLRREASASLGETTTDPPSQHSSQKAGTWSRSRTRILHETEKKPPLTRSKSLMSLNFGDLVRFPAELGIFTLQGMRKTVAVEDEDLTIAPFSFWPLSSPSTRDVIQQELQRLSELHTGIPTSSTGVVKSILASQGALQQLTRSLEDAPLKMQLELLKTISKLLLRNPVSQREFTNIKGYISISGVLMHIDRKPEDEKSRNFLVRCFAIITAMVIDGNRDYLIANITAFSWLIGEISTNSLLFHSNVFPFALGALNDLLLLNSANAAAFLEYVAPIFTCRSHVTSESARDAVDQLVCNIGFALALHNSVVLHYLLPYWRVFDVSIVHCTLRLLQQRNACKAPRSPDVSSLIALVGKRLTDTGLSTGHRTLLIQILVLAALSGEYCTDFGDNGELSPSTLDLDEAMDVLFSIAANSMQDCELCIHMLGVLSSVSSSWSAASAVKLGQHADREQHDNNGLRLLFVLLQKPNVNTSHVISAIASVLSGAYQNFAPEFTKIRQEFCFMGGIKVLLDVILDNQSDKSLAQSAMHTLFSAIANCHFAKIQLENQSRIEELFKLLMSWHPESLCFQFLFELSSESEFHSSDFCCTFVKLPVSIDSVVSELGNWRSAHQLTDTRCFSSPDLWFETCNDLHVDSSSSLLLTHPGNAIPPRVEKVIAGERTTRRQLRTGSKSTLQCLKLCVSCVDTNMQASFLNKILELVQDNPISLKILSDIAALSFLLRKWTKFPLHILGVRSPFFSLLTTLGRYSIEPGQARLLFDLASRSAPNTESPFDGLTRMQILDVVSSLSSRDAPESYFNFNVEKSLRGFGSVISPAIGRLPVAKIGYTVMFWFRICEFVAEETSLLTWVQGDAPLFEFLFKLTPRRDCENERSLCVRSPNHGTFMLDLSHFLPFTSKLWHMMAISHNRAGISVAVDSKVIGRFASVPYPSVLTKRDVCKLHIGAKSFVGQIAAVHLFEGVADEARCSSYFAQGTLAFGHNPDSKCFMKIQPVVDCAEIPMRDRVPSVTLPGTSPPRMAVVPVRALSVSSLPEIGVFIPHNADVHQTMAIPAALNMPGVGGLFLCLPFIGEMKPGCNGPRLIALQILSSLLFKYQENLSQFEVEGGYDMLTHCLIPAHLSMDILGMLLDIACMTPSGGVRGPISNLPCLTLIMDLLRHSTGPDTRNEVVGMISDLLRDEPNIWFDAGGVSCLLELLSIASKVDESHASSVGLNLLNNVLTIIEQVLMTSSGTAELDILVSFVVTDDPETESLLNEKTSIAELLCHCFERREFLLSSISFHLLLPMLKSTSSAFRISCIRMLAMIFRNSSRAKIHFVKTHGFDIMLRLLAKHQPADELTCDAIFDLALDRLNIPSHNYISGVSTSRQEDAPNVLVHPEAIRLLLELLRLASSRPILHLRYVERIEELIESRFNLNALLVEPWLHWCRQYLEGVGRHHSLDRPVNVTSSPTDINLADNESVSSRSASIVSSSRGENQERLRTRLITRFVRLIQKMLVKDLSWHTGRASCIPKLLLMVEASEFVSLVIDRVLNFFEKYPRIGESEAPCLIRNLARICESIDELCGHNEEKSSARWSVRLIHLINLIASKNSSDLRTRMKQVGLFNIRDHLLLRFCQQPCSSADRFVALSQLSLDAVASDVKFRNSDGLLYLLRWFTADPDDSQCQLRVLLLDVIRHRLGNHPESKKDLEKALADTEIYHRLFELSVSDSDFISWFLKAERAEQRACISSRLEKSLALTEINVKKQSEKMQEKRQKRVRARLETLGKAAAASERAVQEALERSELIMKKYHKILTSQRTRMTEARIARIDRGAKAFALKCQELESTRVRTQAISTECSTCQNLRQNKWELLCHFRLDHWQSEPPAAPSALSPDSIGVALPFSA